MSRFTVVIFAHHSRFWMAIWRVTDAETWLDLKQLVKRALGRTIHSRRASIRLLVSVPHEAGSANKVHGGRKWLPGGYLLRWMIDPRRFASSVRVFHSFKDKGF